MVNTSPKSNTLLENQNHEWNNKNMSNGALAPLEAQWLWPEEAFSPAVWWLSVGGQFFLALDESYLRLLEYQRSRGIPMDGKVMTPKAAQSR